MAALRWVLVVLVATTSATHADLLRATREQPLREVSHTVNIRIAGGVATYVVERKFENRGTTADEVVLSIDLPAGASATGLRIRAKKQWHEGELLAAETARERYQELTGRGVWDAKDPALLYWLDSNRLGLQVFPVLPKSVSTVEYTLTVPTVYRGGRYHLTYGRITDATDTKLVDPQITVQGADTIMVDGRQVRGRATLTAYDADSADRAEPDNDPDALPTLARLSVAPRGLPMWSARLGRVVASQEHAFTRFELDLAPQLTALPRGAQVVFAIDASHSAGPKGIESQLAIARAYARHVPDAQVELVVYQRTAKRVFGRFVPASGLPAAIREAARKQAFAPGNGSALDEGARIAATALAGRTGPRRIVLLTDELVRSALAPEAAVPVLASIDPAIVVHVVVPHEVGPDQPKLARDDDAPFAPLATTHHGLYARVAIDGTERELANTVLELVRPVRIDGLEHDLGEQLALPDTLAEGEGVRRFETATSDEAPKRVALRGKLWSDPIELAISEDTTFSRATAAFVWGANLSSALSDTEMMVVALLGRAVSPVTSYLAIEPGVRPSTIGLERSGWGTIGSGRYGTIGHGSGTTGSAHRRPDLSSLIDSSTCVKAHAPAAGWSVKLEVETTRDEIVDVRVRNGFGAIADCLVETVWRVRLDSRFDRERDSFIVDLM